MFKLNVLTPERKAVFDQEITEVTVPAYAGEMTILPGHAPLITTLGTGVLRYKIKGQDKTYKAVLSWGYCEVMPGTVNVLAEFIQTPEEVVTVTAQNNLQVAEKKLATESLSDQDYEYTQGEAAKARAAISLTLH
jgi:F-type H+-transporting ATPase subunit epsilon